MNAVLPRGIRNNNPGNLEINSIDWLGMSAVQDDPPFIKFDKPEYGIRAIARDFKTMQREGVTTIEEAINRWAPPAENDTQAYIAAVATACGVSPTQVVDFTALLPEILPAIIEHENGQQPYTAQLIAYAISLS